MDILNGAIDSLMGTSNKEDWTPVALNVADATVTISKDKVRLRMILLYICTYICIYGKSVSKVPRFV